PRLRARSQLQQFHSAPDYLYVVARSELPGLRQETVFLRRVESQHPLEMFLARQNERERLEMRVDQKEESLVADRLALEIQDVDRVAAQQHFDGAHGRRRPFFIGHFVAAGIEPHHVPDLRAANPAALKKFRPAKNRM